MLLMERPHIRSDKDNSPESAKFVFQIPLHISCSNGMEAWSRARILLQPEFDRLAMSCTTHAEPEDVEQSESALRKLQHFLDEFKSQMNLVKGSIYLDTRIEFHWSK